MGKTVVISTLEDLIFVELYKTLAYITAFWGPPAEHWKICLAQWFISPNFAKISKLMESRNNVEA